MLEIEIETWGVGVDAYPIDLLERLPGVIAECGGHGASVSIGGLTGGIGASFGVAAEEGAALARSFADAMLAGTDTFSRACEILGLEHGGLARVAIAASEMLTLENDQPSEELYGVTELARTLGVSRQRLAELRTRQDFPSPIVELAAGPVWTGSSLRRFEAVWERKPGRPRRSAV